MRVLHLTAGNLFGGIESTLLATAQYAPGCPGLEAAFGVCFEGRLSADLRKLGARVYDLCPVRIRRPWTLLRARHRLADVLAELAPEAVICHSCWPHVLFAPVVRARRLPLVFRAHDVYRGRHWLERWSRLTRPDLIMCNSEFTRSFLGKLFPGVLSVTIYQPVPARVPTDREGNRRRMRAALQTPQDAVVIVQASRLEHWKGHGLLLDALGQLASVPGWVCWIAGGAQRPHEETYFGELRHRASRLGIGERVRFLGQRADVPDILAAADIHCQPNTGPEPFGVAFVEALYAGLPVVTTSMGGALEIVDKDCGVLVPPAALEALATALLRLIRDPGLRTDLGLRGRVKAEELCNPTSQLKKIEGALEQVVHCGASA